MIKTNKKRLPYAIFRQAVMIIATFCFLAPFVIVFMVSLKTGSDVYSTTIFPKKATLDNYAYVFSSTSILKSFSNTIFYVALPLLVGVLTSSSSGHSHKTADIGKRCLYLNGYKLLVYASSEDANDALSKVAACEIKCNAATAL